MSTVQRPGGDPAGGLKRADARRNLEAILAAAREVFLEQGIVGSVEEIARRAGVGVGTIYRRFPTKDNLVDAIIAEHLDDLLTRMQAYLEMDDPWEAFCAMLRQTLILFAENRGFKAVTVGRFHQHGTPPQPVLDLMEASERVVRRAQEAGDLRADFALSDLAILFRSVGSVMEDTREVSPRQWERYLTMHLDGLRADAATPLPVGPLTEAEQLAMGRPQRRDPSGRC